MPIELVHLLFAGVIITALNIVITITLIRRFKRDNPDTSSLQMQIEALDCDAVNLRMQQDTLRAKLDRLGEGREVNIHHVHEMDPKAFAEAVDRQLRHSRSLGND